MVKNSYLEKYLFFIYLFFFFLKGKFFFLVNIFFFSFYNFRDVVKIKKNFGLYSLNVRRIPHIVR